MAADGSINVQSAPAPAPAEAQGNGEARSDEGGGDEERFGDGADDYGSDWSTDDFARRPQGDEDEKAPLQLRDAEPTLREHLMEQLAPLKISARDKGRPSS